MKLLPALTGHLLHLSGTHWPWNPTPLPTTHPSREKSTYCASLNKAITLSWNAQNHVFLGGENGLYQIVLLSPNHLVCFYHMCDEKNSREKGGVCVFFFLVLLLIYTGKWKDSPSPEGFCIVHKATYSCWIATVGVKALQQRAGQFKPNNNLTLSQVRQCPQSFSASVTACFPGVQSDGWFGSSLVHWTQVPCSHLSKVWDMKNRNQKEAFFLCLDYNLLVRILVSIVCKFANYYSY